MQWTDEGIVLGVKRHGEGNAILELMTREHGRHLGLVRGGSGSRLKPVLQPRDLLRLEEVHTIRGRHYQFHIRMRDRRC